MTEMTATAVKEIAALADRSNLPVTHTFKVHDPWTGAEINLPLAFHGAKQIDIASEVQKWRTAPSHRLGTASTDTLQSFCDLVNRHKDESSAIFGALKGDKPYLLAVVDYHTIARTPRFGNHRIKYDFPLSDEWKAWRAANNVAMSQVAFASWIEDHMHEFAIAEEAEALEYEAQLGVKFGSPHEILNVSRGISIHAELKVGKAVTLATGESQIEFSEAHTVKDSDAKPIKIPGLVLVSIPMFFGGAPIRIPVRLRYERRGSEVSWKFILFRAERILAGYLETYYDEALNLTGLPGFLGSPEA